MRILFWLLTVLGTVVGGLFFFGALVAPTVPQQAGDACLAVASAALPYIFARAIAELTILFAQPEVPKRRED